MGQDTWEEINDITKGSNYGWPTTEGPTTDARFKTPYYYYGHADGCSIIGGAFYNPPVQQFPASYVGNYFYGDYCAGYIKQLDVGAKTVDLGHRHHQPHRHQGGQLEGAVYYVAIGGTLTR